MGATLGDQLSQPAATAARVSLQAIRVSFRATTLTARPIRNIMRGLTRKVSAIATDHAPGKNVTMRMLGGNIESVEIDKQEDIKVLKRDLRRYQVDFHITHDRDTDRYTVYFAGKNISAVKQSLQKIVAEWDQNAGRKPMKERFNTAKEASAQLNAARKVERSAEKTAEQAVEKLTQSRDAR